MSRRASFFNKQNPGKPRVRFADELVFNDNVKEQDIPAMEAMLRRSSLQMDINSINSAGLTPLHQAVLDGNIAVTKLLVAHGADVNKQDEDFWTPLHAACAEGHSDIVKYLLTQGADRQILTDNGERPLDLVEPTDFSTIKVMLEDVAASCSQTENSDEEDDDDDDDAENDDEGEGNRGRRRNYGDDDDDQDDDDDDHHNDHGDDNDDDHDDDRHHGGKDDNIHRNARLLEDEDVMGDLEYVSPEEEDEEEENRRRRRLRQSERSRSGSKSTSEHEVHYRSEEDRLDVEDSEFEQRPPQQKHEKLYSSQGEEEISDEDHFELQENYYQQNPDLNYDIENENAEFDEPTSREREFEEDISDRSDHECRQRHQRQYMDGVSDDDRKGRFYYDIEGEDSDELNRHRRHVEHDDHHQCDSGEERYYREINKDTNNNSNNEDSRGQQYDHRQHSGKFRGDSTEKERLSNITSEHSENEHLSKPGEVSADEIAA